MSVRQGATGREFNGVLAVVPDNSLPGSRPTWEEKRTDDESRFVLYLGYGTSAASPLPREGARAVVHDESDRP